MADTATAYFEHKKGMIVVTDPTGIYYIPSDSDDPVVFFADKNTANRKTHAEDSSGRSVGHPCGPSDVWNVRLHYIEAGCGCRISVSTKKVNASSFSEESAIVKTGEDLSFRIEKGPDCPPFCYSISDDIVRVSHAEEVVPRLPTLDLEPQGV